MGLLRRHNPGARAYDPDAYIKWPIPKERERGYWQRLWMCRKCGHSLVLTDEKLTAAYAAAVSAGRRRIEWDRDFTPAK